MTTPLPHSPAELYMAPVLISIERNLEPIRDSENIELALALELNDDDQFYHSAQERAERVLRVATRMVELHGWQVTPTADHYGLAVEHGNYRVSLMLGKRATDYVEHGLAGESAPEAPSAAPAEHAG